jgi:hypothetical protein
MNGSKVVAVAAGLALAGASAMAIAAYNTPAKAKGIKTDLVVAYHVCPGPANATQFFGNAPLPACTPPNPVTNDNPTNEVTFGPKGSMNVAVALGSGDIKFAFKGADVQNNGSPFTGNLTAAAKSVISTSNACAAGAPPQPKPAPGAGIDCTSEDLGALFSAVFEVPCTAGKCGLKSSVNTIAPNSVSSGSLANTQISGIGMQDPDGDVAFTSGLFIP